MPLQDLTLTYNDGWITDLNTHEWQTDLAILTVPATSRVGHYVAKPNNEFSLVGPMQTFPAGCIGMTTPIGAFNPTSHHHAAFFSTTRLALPTEHRQVLQATTWLMSLRELSCQVQTNPGGPTPYERYSNAPSDPISAQQRLPRPPTSQ